MSDKQNYWVGTSEEECREIMLAKELSNRNAPSDLPKDPGWPRKYITKEEAKKYWPDK